VQFVFEPLALTSHATTNQVVDALPFDGENVFQAGEGIVA
jgi:hypothetical protein